jgi:hypothetical protein
VPQTGQKNALFGVYKSACCGNEIVIAVGTLFPACSNCMKLGTTWKRTEIRVDNVVVFKKKSKDSAA